jgi:HEAT repeat protein
MEGAVSVCFREQGRDGSSLSNWSQRPDVGVAEPRELRALMIRMTIVRHGLSDMELHEGWDDFGERLALAVRCAGEMPEPRPAIAAKLGAAAVELWLADARVTRACESMLALAASLDEATIVRLLTARLADGEPNVQVRAAKALGEIGRGVGAEAVARLVEHLDEDRAYVDGVGVHAAVALAKMGFQQGITALILRLEDPWATPARALGTIGGAAREQAIALLVDGLLDRNVADHVQDSFLDHLREMGDDLGEQAIAALVLGLESLEHRIRINAAKALLSSPAMSKQIGEEARSNAISILTMQLEDHTDFDYRDFGAAKALGSSGAPIGGRATIALLRACLESASDHLNQLAAESLRRIGGEARQDAYLSLVARLAETPGNTKARSRGILALGEIGDVSDEVIASLAACVEQTTEDRGIRWAAVVALGRIGRGEVPTVVPALLRAVRGTTTRRDPLLIIQAIDALGRIGKGIPKDAVAALVARLGNGQPFTFRDAAAKALGRIGKGIGPSAIAALYGKVNDYSGTVLEALANLHAEGVRIVCGRPWVVDDLARWRLTER